MENLLIKMRSLKKWILLFVILFVISELLIINGTPKQYSYKTDNTNLREIITQFGQRGLKKENGKFSIEDVNGQFSTYQNQQIGKIIITFYKLPQENAFNIRYSKGNLNDQAQFSNWYAVEAKNKVVTFNFPEKGIHSVTLDFISNMKIKSIKVAKVSDPLIINKTAHINYIMSIIYAITISCIFVFIMKHFSVFRGIHFYLKKNYKRLIYCLILSLLLMFVFLIIQRILGMPTITIHPLFKYFNYPLVIFDAAVSISVSLLCMYYKNIRKRLELIFLIIAIPAGLSITFSQMNTVHLVWDAPGHMNEVVKLSSAVYDSYSSYYLGYGLYPAGGDVNISFLTHDIYKSNSDYKISKLKKNATSYSVLTYYKAIGYLPMAIGMTISRGLNMSFSNSLLMCKLFNLFSYIGIMYFAIKNAKYFRIFFLIVALLPTSMILASEFSYDPWLTCMLAASFSYFVNIMMGDDKVNNNEAVKASLLMLLAVGSKPVYCPIILIMFLIPKDKFSNDAQRKKIYCVLVAMISFATISFLLPLIFSTTSGSSFADTRGGSKVDGLKQIIFILNHPIFYTNLILTFIFRDYLNYSALIYLSGYGFGGFFNSSPFLMMNTIPIITSLFLTNSNKKTNNFNLKRALLAILVCLIVIATYSTSMYIAFTAVGAKHVSGVQVRYVIPLLILMFICLSIFIKKIYIKFVNLEMLYSFILAFVLYTTIFYGIIKLYTF